MLLYIPHVAVYPPCYCISPMLLYIPHLPPPHLPFSMLPLGENDVDIFRQHRDGKSVGAIGAVCSEINLPWFPVVAGLFICWCVKVVSEIFSVRIVACVSVCFGAFVNNLPTHLLMLKFSQESLNGFFQLLHSDGYCFQGNFYQFLVLTMVSVKKTS